MAEHEQRQADAGEYECKQCKTDDGRRHARTGARRTLRFQRRFLVLRTNDYHGYNPPTAHGSHTIGRGEKPEGSKRSAAFSNCPSGYQLRVNPAEMLLSGMPVVVSLTEPLTLMPPNNFCSAPTLRSHFSLSVDIAVPTDSDVPVGSRLSFAELSDEK